MGGDGRGSGGVVAVAGGQGLNHRDIEKGKRLNRQDAKIYRVAIWMAVVCGLVVAGAMEVGRGMAGEFLAYESIKDGDWDIYGYDPAREITLNLTRFSGGHDVSPAFSRDNRMAFVSTVGSVRTDIYLMDLRDGRWTNISNSPAPDYDPVWSADHQLVYVTARDGGSGRLGNLELVLYTQTPMPLTHNEAEDFDPMWLPDGRVAFTSRRNGHLGVYALDVATREQMLLTAQSDARDVYQLAWSANGQAAYTVIHDGTSDIYALDGTIITDGAGAENDPQWSPDGTRLAFVSTRTVDLEVFVLDVATGATINVSRHPYSDTAPRWSQDGRLAFFSYRRPVGLYLVDAPGDAPRLVGKDGQNPVWWRWG